MKVALKHVQLSLVFLLIGVNRVRSRAQLGGYTYPVPEIPFSYLPPDGSPSNGNGRGTIDLLPPLPTLNNQGQTSKPVVTIKPLVSRAPQIQFTTSSASERVESSEQSETSFSSERSTFSANNESSIPVRFLLKTLQVDESSETSDPYASSEESFSTSSGRLSSEVTRRLPATSETPSTTRQQSGFTSERLPTQYQKASTRVKPSQFETNANRLTSLTEERKTTTTNSRNPVTTSNSNTYTGGQFTTRINTQPKSTPSRSTKFPDRPTISASTPYRSEVTSPISKEVSDSTERQRVSSSISTRPVQSYTRPEQSFKKTATTGYQQQSTARRQNPTINTQPSSPERLVTDVSGISSTTPFATEPTPVAAVESVSVSSTAKASASSNGAASATVGGSAKMMHMSRPYEFGYAVDDSDTDNAFSQKESSDGMVITGEYRWKMPDGRTQIVTYLADWAAGFYPKIRYE